MKPSSMREQHQGCDLVWPTLVIINPNQLSRNELVVTREGVT